MTSTPPQDDRARQRLHDHEADVVVVGAGVFGCAAAHTLANQGRSVILLERWMRQPNRIVGELMQPGGLRSLRKLGLQGCVENIDAVPCTGYDVLYYGRDVSIPYPYLDDDGNVIPERKAQAMIAASKNGHTNGNANGSANGHTNRHANGHANGATHPKKNDMKRPEGVSFHHGRFINELRKACLKHPNITVFETEVISTITSDHSPQVLGVQTRTTDPETGEKHLDTFFAQLNIIADGYASKFRKQYVTEAPVVRSKFYALELIDCDLPHKGHGHVVIGAPSPVLLYQIGTHETRVLVDVPEKLPEAAPAAGGVRGYMRNTVLPILPASVQPSFLAALDKEDKIPPSMPNSWLPPSRQTHNSGVIVLGDAMNMRHPLTGGGMTVALNDVVILDDVLSMDKVPDFGDTAAVSRAMEELHKRRKSLTGIINVLAQALYSLFSAQDPQLAKLRRGCFEYFVRGNSDEPVSMLGGVLENPATLTRHFFTVALLAIWLDWKDNGLWNLPLNLWSALALLWTATYVFLPVLWRELAK
ncbi:squalene monooxygenase [Microdochium nivale]|nr:squalene monooxygenase [Microdochium nivale]